MIRVWNCCLSVAMRRKLPCGTHFGYKARKQSTTQKTITTQAPMPAAIVLLFSKIIQLLAKSVSSR